MARSHSGENSLPVWKELADPHYEPPPGDRPSAVPSESQRKIREHLKNVAREWVNTAGEPENGEGDAELPVFTRTQGQGHPAAWVGGGVSGEGNFEGVILCTELFCLREPLYVGSSGEEHWQQALVGLGNGDAVIYVRGKLPVEPGNETIEANAYRVESRQDASSPGSEGLVEVDPLKAREFFFRLLRKHPKIGGGLSTEGRDGRQFVADGEETPDTEPCEGVVEKFFEDEGYGFIESDDVKEDIFFHEKDVDGEKPQIGDCFTFDLAESLRRPRALNLRAAGENRKEGVVDWFDEGRGYGFIQVPGNGLDDVFVHTTDVETPLCEGDPVEFSVEMEDEGPRAANVEKVSL